MIQELSSGLTGEDATFKLKGNPDNGAMFVELLEDGASTAVSRAQTTALATSLVVKASGGSLVGILGFNNSASDQYIQVHNAASLPANTAVPIVTFKVFAGDNFFWVPPKPLPLDTGIVVCNSSTAATKTIGAADCWFNVEYY